MHYNELKVDKKLLFRNIWSNNRKLDPTELKKQLLKHRKLHVYTAEKREWRSINVPIDKQH